MKNIHNEAPEVAEAFRNLTESIDHYAGIDPKTKELILIGIFTAEKAMRGIDTHVRRALEHGASKNEIVSSILYAMPVVGISSVTLAIETALNIINADNKQIKLEGV